MVELRYLAVVACCLWVNTVWCGASPVPQYGREARARRAASDDRPAARTRDYDLDSVVFAKLILRELARELRNDNPAATPPVGDDQMELRDVTDAMAKRKPFWQPMGGPLPVETRLASFGTKIIPDDSHNAPNRFKAMRYGRR